VCITTTTLRASCPQGQGKNQRSSNLQRSITMNIRRMRHHVLNGCIICTTSEIHKNVCDTSATYTCVVRSDHPWHTLRQSLKAMAARRPQGAMLAYGCNIHFQPLDSNQSRHPDSGVCMEGTAARPSRGPPPPPPHAQLRADMRMRTRCIITAYT